MQTLGQTAVVTGGTRGLGLGIAEALAKAGYDTVTIARGPGADVVADAARDGITVAAFRERLGAVVTPEVAGAAVLEVLAGPAAAAGAYSVSAAGLAKIE